VINLICAVLLIVNELLQLLAEEVHLTEIQWSKICKEGFIHQIVINAEIKGMRPRFWRVPIRDPVETTRDDLY
jgi:hypothetical protein